MRHLPTAVPVVAVLLLGCGGDGDRDQTTADRPVTTEAEIAVETTSTSTSAPQLAVTRVIDGDTLVIGNDTVRLIGIDTPERGVCGADVATRHLRDLVADARVTVHPGTTGSDDGSTSDRDRYGRLLRYVDVDGVGIDDVGVDKIDDTDAGLSLIEAGLAVARYDSRDGYSRHDRQDAYVVADEAAENLTCPTTPATTAAPPATVPPTAPAAPPPPPPPPPAPSPAPAPPPAPAPGTYYENCDAARAAGAAPVHRGDPGYGDHLDRDDDGIGCE